MSLLVLVGALGAGLGLSTGLAFNLRLARTLGTPLAATLVNFLVGATVLLTVWLAGVDGRHPMSAPPPWMLLGGLLGATYVTLSLFGAARLGVAVSTIAVTLGQVLGALIIGTFGLLQQPAHASSASSLLSTVLLLAAVVVLARDRK